MSEWRPIGTAPQDGTRVLGINKFREVGHTHWLPEDDECCACWWNEQQDDEWSPLYWMPALPDPFPADTSGK